MPMTLSLLLRRFAIVRLLLAGLLTVFALSANAATDSSGATLNHIYWNGNYGIWNKALDACKSYSRDYPTASGATVQFDSAYNRFKCIWDGAYQIAVDRTGNCLDGTVTFDQSTGVSTCKEDNVAPTYPPMDATTACAGYPTIAGLAAADSWVREPRTFAYNVGGANGVATITGGTAVAGKSYTYGIDCYGKGRIGDGDGTKLPAPTPSPAPSVDTAYPKCGVGNYLYTDETGQSTCSQNLPDRTVSDCASKNGGYVNGKAVCLPANPAPTVAASAATTAQQKADAAVAAGRGTAGAVAAANDAATAYRRAAEASNSMPTSTPAATSAAMAFGSATQAAIAAGMSVPAPLPNPGTATGTGTGGNGTGTENTGPKECGSPGKPKCLIDETGTPSAADGSKMIQDQTDSMNKNMDSRNDSLKSETDANGTQIKKQVVTWDFGFSLPSGCTPYQMFLNVVIDYCKFQPIIHDLMSLVWLSATIFACISMVGNAMRSANA